MSGDKAKWCTFYHTAHWSSPQLQKLGHGKTSSERCWIWNLSWHGKAITYSCVLPVTECPLLSLVTQVNWPPNVCLHRHRQCVPRSTRDIPGIGSAKWCLLVLEERPLAPLQVESVKRLLKWCLQFLKIEGPTLRVRAARHASQSGRARRYQQDLRDGSEPEGPLGPD